MQHDIYTEKISMWLDGELPPQEITELEAHLVECPVCRHTQRAMQQLDTMFRAAAVTMARPQPGFSRRVEKRLARHTPYQRRHMLLGVLVLLLGTVFFAAGSLATGIALIGAGSNLLDISLVYYGLGLVGSTVNEVRLAANLAELAVRVAVLTMQQPLFWGYAAAALGLAALWLKLMQVAYKRVPVTIQMML